MATATTIFRARVPTERLRRAEKLLAKVGMKPSDAFNVFLAQVEQVGGFPLDIRPSETEELLANREFLEHLAQMKAGKVTYTELKDLPE